MNKSTHRGFTLLEILVSVVILSVLSFAGLNIINSNSPERVITQQAQRFISQIKYLCEKSIVENSLYGIEFMQGAYQVLKYNVDEQWINAPQIAGMMTASINQEIVLEFKKDGLAQQLPKEFKQSPHMYCSNDGSLMPFELNFSYAEQSYSITSKDPWELSGEWLNQ